MKRIITLAFAATLALGGAMAQQPQQSRQPQQPRPAQHQLQFQDTLGARHRHGDVQRAHQQRHCGRHGDCPHAQQAVSPEKQMADAIAATLKQAFPTLKRTNKTDRWTEVFDAKGTLLGYAVSSKPASDGIRGYNGETPVLITLNAKNRITGVYLLPNSETPRFAQRVKDAGFYDNWNGLTIKKARKKKVDTVSGATYTSRAVAQSVQAALEKL